jgi:peptidoglycan/xylan/chitin deacetylase (PgdA/CDA1 family)
MMAARPLLVLALLIASLGPAAAAGPDSAAAVCWPADALRAVEAERAPRRGGPSARIAPPAITPMAGTPLAPALRGSVRRLALPPGRKLIALTFDLCEANGEVTGYDGGIVDYLRANGVKATFFAGGKWLETHSERAQQLIADPLFQLGSHSWSHRNMRKLTGPALKDEIERAEAAYEDIRAALARRPCIAAAPEAMARIPERLGLFRFPYGTCSPAALDAVNDAGLVAVQWDVVTGDPVFGRSAERIAATVLQRAKPGSIVIAHANGKGLETARALPLFVPRLQAQGYEFVTVGEMLAAGTPVAAETCYEERPGDNDRY